MKSLLEKIAKNKDTTVKKYLAGLWLTGFALAIGIPMFRAFLYDPEVWGKSGEWQHYVKFGLIILASVPFLVFLYDLDRANRGIRPEDDTFRRR